MTRHPADTAEPHLLERVARGEAGAVRAIIDRYGDLVWSLARSFVRNDAEAEDAVQDIFVMLWRKASRYDRRVGSEATFISVLARRVLIDRWRREARRPKPAPIEPLLVDRTAADDGEFSDLCRHASRVFNSLGDDEQLVLRLSIGYGFSHQMVADATNLPLGTVKTRIRRALAQIRDQMAPGAMQEGARP